jgi:hypothetical protein
VISARRESGRSGRRQRSPWRRTGHRGRGPAGSGGIDYQAVDAGNPRHGLHSTAARSSAEVGRQASRHRVSNLTFITAADPPIGQACDLRVHAHRPPILRTSGWAICTPGRLESARSAVSMSDPNTNPTVSGSQICCCAIYFEPSHVPRRAPSRNILGNTREPPCDLRKSTDEVRTSLIKVR